MAKTVFSEKQIAAMKTMGLPTDLDVFLSVDEDTYFRNCEAIKRELLGPGLDMSGELNEYGDALRSCLDAIASREYELHGPLIVDPDTLTWHWADEGAEGAV